MRPTLGRRDGVSEKWEKWELYCSIELFAIQARERCRKNRLIEINFFIRQNAILYSLSAQPSHSLREVSHCS